ncbi:MAG: tetratricopeptide repeat protein [Betaproteobacteria bacterium]|nr:tetratricopeptide repeat protein [Betaproteobacteria bacterium]
MLVVAASGFLVACASIGTKTPEAQDQGLEASLARAAEQGDAGRAVRDGVQALLVGDSRLAAKAFSRALKLDPENSRLHLLNALAYHLGYAQGAHANRDLAETGYLVALRFDPNNVVAAQMLGQLYLDSGRYQEARRWIGRSLLLGESSARVYHAFAVASYYTRDLRLALWAISQAERADENSGPVLRAGTLIRAAAGQFDAAEERRRRYDSVETNALLRRSLTERVAQWRTALSSLDDAVGTKSEQPPVPDLLVQAPAAGAAPVYSSAQGTGSGPLAPNWSDCAGPAQPSGTYGAAAGAAGGADETVQLPSAAKIARPPRKASICCSRSASPSVARCSTTREPGCGIPFPARAARISARSIAP